MKFMKVTVEKRRKAVVDLYIGVSDDFRRRRLFDMECLQEIVRIARETTTDRDWDETGWQDRLEVTDVFETSEEEARQYNLGVLRTRDITDDELRQLNPIDVQCYAAGLGWRQVHMTDSDTDSSTILLQHPTKKFLKLLIPTNESKDDNLSLLYETVRTLAEDQKRHPRDVLKSVIRKTF